MAKTINLLMDVSSDQDSYVLEYWNAMLNEQNGNFAKLDREFGNLVSKLDFNIQTTDWVPEDNPPFHYKATVVLSNTLIADNSMVEAFFNNVLVSAGVVLYSVTQVDNDLILVFYADTAKTGVVEGFIKYIYSTIGLDPMTVTPAE